MVVVLLDSVVFLLVDIVVLKAVKVDLLVENVVVLLVVVLVL